MFSVVGHGLHIRWNTFSGRDTIMPEELPCIIGNRKRYVNNIRITE